MNEWSCAYIQIHFTISITILWHRILVDGKCASNEIKRNAKNCDAVALPFDICVIYIAIIKQTIYTVRGEISRTNSQYTHALKSPALFRSPNTKKFIFSTFLGTRHDSLLHFFYSFFFSIFSCIRFVMFYDYIVSFSSLLRTHTEFYFNKFFFGRLVVFARLFFCLAIEFSFLHLNAAHCNRWRK